MNVNTYGIDGHKLHYHVSRVSDWLKGDVIYPVYMEISPSGACNHRCVFCGVDYLGYQPRSIDAGILKERLSELSSLGLKSVMYCGEGEPLLHKDIAGIVNHTKKAGIDTAITTNGVLLNESLSEMILGDLEWIKISFNAGTEETYKKINGAKDGDFNRVLKNLRDARKIKDANRYGVTIGLQMILLPENMEEVVPLARIARDIGVDYLVVKPYSQNPQSLTVRYKGLTYDNLERLKGELEECSANGFSAFLRVNALGKTRENRKVYDRCLALPFWAYIDSGGAVWGCLDYIGDERFYYGNIYESDFKSVWESESRMKSLRLVECGFDITKCRSNCRMDEINRYLWSLRHEPPPHVNFI